MTDAQTQMKKKVLVADKHEIAHLQVKSTKVKITEVEHQLKQIEQLENIQSQEDSKDQEMKQQADNFEADDQDINSLEQLVKVGHSDIKVASKQKTLYQAVLRSVSVVAQNEKYKGVLLKTDKKLVHKFMDLFKLPMFRKEVVEVLTMMLNLKLIEPNYVVILGTEFQLSVKYSRGTLLQLLIGDTFNLTMFNVPRIAINTFKEK